MIANKNFIWPFVMVIFIACNNSEKEIITDTEKITNSPDVLFFDLADTINPNKIFTGRLHYNMGLNKFDASEISSRYVFFHFLINDGQEPIGLEEIKKDKNSRILEDTVGNGQFSFQFRYNADEEVKNNKFFHGVIEDIRLLKDRDSSENTTINTKAVLLTKKLEIKEPGQ